jgi:hypothetical protein
MIPPTRRRSFSEQLRVGLHSAGNGIRPHAPRSRHLIETAARPFLPHPRHRSRPFKSSTLAAGLRPALRSASGVSSATVGRRRNRP